MAVVWTIEERCKRCYTCIRECPAKAIKVEKGQAKVIEQRCVGCGHCVRVCSQEAKAIVDGIRHTVELLENSETVVAMIAPSFPANFPNAEPERVIGALRRCGFTHVVEVAFGADLINLAYRKISEKNDTVKRPVITSSCPAIYTYVEKYAPELIDNLAPIVSPMVATGRVVSEFYGSDARRVFIGPCTAKKVEMRDPEVSDSVDEVLTFRELEKIFEVKQVDINSAPGSWFDPPHPHLGRLYPISGGLIRSAGMPFDIMDNDIVLTEGKHRIMDLLDSIKNKEVQANLADMLFCEGCINGPFMSHEMNAFTRKQKVVEFTKKSTARVKQEEWEAELQRCEKVKITRKYKPEVINLPEPTEADIRQIFEKIGKFSAKDELNCGACGYHTCREYARAVFLGLAEPEMCLPFLIDKYERIQKQLRRSLEDLAEAQEQLIQTEKLASIGQLAAGVAHEVNNPLGSIILFSHLVLQQMEENSPTARDIKFIIEEADRCRNIVSGLLNFARQGRLSLQKVDVAELLKKMVRATAQQPEFKKVGVKTEISDDLPLVDLDPDQIYQVFLNLAQNAAEAMPHGGKLVIKAGLNEEKDRLRIQFKDNGIGIPPENIGKLFTPFFTTKQIGKGTGLGLAIAYGIIKMHKGSITVESEEGKGSTFTVELPLNLSEQV
ncbi:MAG: hypothetical protein Kow0037_22990 [Calditrichia bacterium]